MKTIDLIRHAKSSWDNPRISDINRPLAQRGVKDCQIMASALNAADLQFGQIYCSSAQRAELTLQTISEHWPTEQFAWQVCDDLYTFSSSGITSFIQSLDDRHKQVLLVGHNPAFNDFINQFAEAELDNLPTCAFARLEFSVCSWSQIANSSATLTHFLKPKMFK